VLVSLASAAVLFLSPKGGVAANLLLNSDFGLNNGNAVPTDWMFFAPPNTFVHDYWIVNSNSVGCSKMPAQSAQYYWKEWFINNGTNNVAGLYQTFSSAPGSIYTASAWLATSSCDQLGSSCSTWVQVEFLDANTNLVGLYKSAIFSSSVAVDAWVQFPVTNVCDVSQPVSVGDPYFTTYAVTGSASQLVAPLGTASVRYRFCYLTVAGNTAGSAFMDTPVLNQVSGPAPPVISSLFPQDTMIFVNPTSGISFTATSPSGFTINNSGIQVILNGTNVSGSLVISGSASSKNVAYHGLQTNSAYTAAISVTDVSNLTVNATIGFQTMWYGLQPVTYLWEAEDWDFTNGMYIDFPDLCNASGDPNCYFGKVGVQGVDENNVTGASGPYRPEDPMGTAAAGDVLRPTLAAANRTDYRIDPFDGAEWVNYTRDWPNSTNWVIGRMCANVSQPGILTLSVVNGDSSTTDLGKFSFTGQGYSAFENVYLKDTNGNNAVVVLNGKKTLRITSGGAALPNFYMLVAAQADLPILSNVYPTGSHPFEPTNTFSFTVTTPGSSFPASGIHVNFDGFDVTPNLQITGTSSSKNVLLPSILPNATHVAIITATNVLGHGIAVTNDFDTFSEENYMFECEDFDYGGGQFIDNPSQPDAYFGFGATTNIDYQHTSLQGEGYAYRTAGIPEDGLNGNDYLRSNYVYYGSPDYVLTFFAANDWANYTRVFPAGTYYAYIRTSGDGPFSLYLDQVVSGAGTVNQTTRRIGHFGGVGKDYITYQWVPLTDDGLVAPAVVTLNGQETLRLTTGGDCNPNYIMFVPTSGIRVRAALSGANTLLSFPSQAGVSYRVFYRTNLTVGNWALLTNVLASGATQTVSDSSGPASKFYKVTAP